MMTERMVLLSSQSSEWADLCSDGCRERGADTRAVAAPPAGRADFCPVAPGDEAGCFPVLVAATGRRFSTEVAPFRRVGCFPLCCFQVGGFLSGSFGSFLSRLLTTRSGASGLIFRSGSGLCVMGRAMCLPLSHVCGGETHLVRAIDEQLPLLPMSSHHRSPCRSCYNEREP